MEKAEAQAEKSSDWVQVASFWLGKFSNRDNGIRCLEQAEAVARRAADWRQIGRTWEGTFGDSESCNRCFRIGYGNVNRFSAWDSPLDTFNNALVDLKAVGEGGVDSLGVIEESCSFQGSWSDQIVSKRRPGCRARYYSFRLPEPVLLGIDLAPGEGTYLYLMSGEKADSPVLVESDSPPEDGSNSRIAQILQEGTYAVEVASRNGSYPSVFTLTIRYRRDPYTYLAKLQE